MIVEGEEVSSIEKGLNILLGIERGDGEEEIERLVSKITGMRIFPDENGKMNLDISQYGGSVLVVSQFTLASNITRGRRPSFDTAMPPKEAESLYMKFCERLSKFVPVHRGVFGAHMKVSIENDGPVTFILESDRL